MPRPAAASIPPDALDLEQVAQLRVAIARLGRRLRQQAETNLTLSHQSALVTIEQHGPLSLGDLARHERIAPATVTKIAHSLVADDLVRRSADPDDGRVVRVAITPAGRRRLDESRRRRTAWLATRLTGPDAPSAEALRTTVDVLEGLAGPDAPDAEVRP